MPVTPNDAAEERTRHWLESSFLEGASRSGDAGVFDEAGAPQHLTAEAFKGLLRKFKVFRLLDRCRFESFIDIGSGFDIYPNLVHDRYGVEAYFSDFAHTFNLPFGGQAWGRLDHAVTLNLARLPFADASFDVVLCSEVLEHLVRPIECVSELLRVTRRCLILTSLEALSYNRWERWKSHLAVDVRQPHVERNFFVLSELAALFGPAWHHENLFYDPHLPAPSFARAAEQEAAAYGAIRSIDALVDALVSASRVSDHRPGAFGLVVARPAAGFALGPPRADDGELARWLVERVAAWHAEGARLMREIRAGTAPFAEPQRPIADRLRSLLRCPDCRGALGVEGTMLCCDSCAASFPSEYGVPILYPSGGLGTPPNEREWLPRLAGDDASRARILRRVVRRLRRNEHPAGRLRQVFGRWHRASTS